MAKSRQDDRTITPRGAPSLSVTKMISVQKWLKCCTGTVNHSRNDRHPMRVSGWALLLALHWSALAESPESLEADWTESLPVEAAASWSERQLCVVTYNLMNLEG